MGQVQPLLTALPDVSFQDRSNLYEVSRPILCLMTVPCYRHQSHSVRLLAVLAIGTNILASD